MNTKFLSVDNYFQKIIENPIGSGKSITVFSLFLSNKIEQEAIEVDVLLEDINKSVYIVKSALIPRAKNLSLFLSKNTGIFLEEGQSISVKAKKYLDYSQFYSSSSSAQDVLEVACSYEIKNIYNTSESTEYDTGFSTIQLSSYFDTSTPVKTQTGIKGGRFIVPEGYDTAIYISNSGQIIKQEIVQPGQILEFKSGIAVGKSNSWIENIYDQFLTFSESLANPCPGSKVKGCHIDLQTGAISFQDCGCFESFLGDLAGIVGGVGGLRQLLKGIAKKRVAREALQNLQGLRQALQQQIDTLKDIFERAIHIGGAKSMIAGYEELARLGFGTIEEYAEIIKSLKEHIENMTSSQSLLDESVVSKITKYIEDGGGMLGKDPEVYFKEYLSLAKDDLKNKNEILYEWIKKVEPDLSPTMETIRVQLQEFASDLDILKSVVNSIKEQMRNAFLGAASIFAGLLAIIELFDVYQDKMCISPVSHNLCGTQADINIETCECNVCPEDRTLCPASLINIYDDRNNTCIKNCCGGAVFSQPSLDPFGRCYCVCPEGTTFKECESGCEPVRLCDSGTVPGGFFASYGLCVDNNEIYQKQNCTWNKQTCSYDCSSSSAMNSSSTTNGSCVVSFIAQYNCSQKEWNLIQTTKQCVDTKSLILDSWVDIPGDVCGLKVKNKVYQQECGECPEYSGPSEQPYGLNAPDCCGSSSSEPGVYPDIFKMSTNVVVW